jgi:iron uptake system component EfeO
MVRVLTALALVALGVVLAGCSDDKGQQVTVEMTEWTVKPSVAEVPAGKVTFSAQNRSASMVHELAILRIEGSDKKNVKEIEDIDPGKTKSTTVNLKAGEYELACVIVPGESGSTVDHYQQGMHTTFRVK